MNKQNYKTFIASIQQMIFDFVRDNNIPSSCKISQTEEDDIQWTLNLGKMFGSVNILLESWDSASYQGKVNVLSIPMKFHTYRDTDNLFKTRYGAVNSFNGKFVLNAFENASESLKNTFSEVLGTWAYTRTEKEKKNPFKNGICMN